MAAFSSLLIRANCWRSDMGVWVGTRSEQAEEALSPGEVVEAMKNFKS